MLVEWYLRQQLAKLNANFPGTFRDPAALRALAKTDQLIISSTAFMYDGLPVVRQFFAVQDQTLATKQRVLQIAASLAAECDEEMLKTVVQAAKEAGEPLREVETESVSEVGVTGKLDRTWYILGDERCMQQEQIELGVTIQTLTQQFEIDGKYTLFLAQRQPKRLLGIFACEYQLLADLPDVITALRDQHIEIVLLTSAKTRIARAMGSKIGISLIHSELQDRDKYRILTALQKQQPDTAVLIEPSMEAPPTATTIAIGKKGEAKVSAVIPEFGDLPLLFKLSRETIAAAKRTLFWCKI